VSLLDVKSVTKRFGSLVAVREVSLAVAPGELRAGLFDYRLFQGGISGSDPNSWFLRSTFLAGC